MFYNIVIEPVSDKSITLSSAGLHLELVLLGAHVCPVQQVVEEEVGAVRWEIKSLTLRPRVPRGPLRPVPPPLW